MPPFGGPLPQSLTSAPPNSGPAVAPHGTPGNTTESLSQIRQALELLQKALPGVPMGSELHSAIMGAVSKIGAKMSEMQESPQMKMQALLGMLTQLKAGQPNNALQSIAGGMGGGGGAPGGGAAPAPPILGGAPPQMAA